MGSMLQMLKNMMEGGNDVGEEPQKGDKAGDQPGQGGGDGDGQASGKTGELENTPENSARRVPKNSGKSGNSLPREFQKAMDAYNKAATQKSNKR